MHLAISGIDAAVLVAYFAGVVLLGVWLGRGQRDVAAYLLGDRNLPWWAVLLSIVATETSTVTFLSLPGLAFKPEGGNLLFLQLTIGYVVGRFVVIFLFLPHFFSGDLFTAYQVLDRRFGGVTKQAASILFLVTRNLSDGLRLFLTAIVLQQMLNLDLWICIVLTGVVTIVYTFAGGMKSVVWNDCIQFFIYIGGALLAGAIILLFLARGSTDLSGVSTDLFGDLSRGWTRLAEFGCLHDKFRLFDFTLDLTRPYTFWSGLFGGIFVTLASHGSDQLMVQRYLSARSRRAAACALGASGFVVLAQFALFMLIGVGLACFYDVFPPQASLGGNDRVFAAFIVDYLPVGVVGVVVAAVLSAAMSTLSSSLNSSATTAANDLYLSWRATQPSPRHLLWVSRVLTVVFGLIQIGVGIVGQCLCASVIEGVMTIATFTIGVVLGVFFLGVLTRWASQRAALIGLLMGLVLMGLIVCFTGLAWPWFALVGSGITFGVGCVASLILPPRRSTG
jgi:solute:Na+ symporter, SSS family